MNILNFVEASELAMFFVEFFFLFVALAAQLLRPSQGQQQLLQCLCQGVGRAAAAEHPNVAQRGRQIQGQDASCFDRSTQHLHSTSTAHASCSIEMQQLENPSGFP